MQDESTPQPEHDSTPQASNGNTPEPITVQLAPAKGHIVITLGLDDNVSFATIGNPGGIATLYGLLEMAKDAVRQVAEAANKPRIMLPGARPPGPGSPGWRPPGAGRR